MRTEDGCIIQRCLNGEPEAFGLLVDKYKAGIYSFAYIRLGDFRDAQDVTQEVFVQAYRDLKSLRRWESFVFWLYRIASTHCGKWIRARSKRPDVQFIEDQNPQILERPSIDSYLENQVNESLKEALYSLHETYREVLALYYFGGMNSVDIAKALGVSPSAIRKRLSRARSQLREEMVAMMSTAFEGQRLQASFTFRIMETVRRIKIHPAPRVTGLPWGLSLAAGIVFTILALNPNINPVNPADISIITISLRETEMAQVGETRVDILKLSQIPAISGKQGNDNSGDPGLPQEQNSLLLAPRGDVEDFPKEPSARLGKGSIGQFVYSPDGKVLAAAGGIGVWLYDMDNLNEIGLLRGHTHKVHSVAFSPNGKMLASGSWDNTIRLWDVDAQNQAALLSGHTSLVSSVAFSPDGKLLASCSYDGTIRLWDIDEQKRIGVLGRTSWPVSVAFSPDGKMLASAGNDEVDGAVRLWNVEEQKQVGILRGHKNYARSVVFSPNGKILASCSYDKIIRLWNVDEQEQVGELQGHEGGVGFIAFGPDGKMLASGGADKKVRLWDVDEQKQVGLLEGHAAWVGFGAFSPDGKTLAFKSNDDIRFWDIDEQKQVGLLQGYTATVSSIAFSPNGKTLASGGWDSAIRLWDVDAQKQMGLLEGHTNEVYSVAFSPDGSTLASCSYDKTIRLWDIAGQKQVGMLKGHTDWANSVAFSPDGKTLASGGEDKTVYLWDIQKQKQVGLLKGHTGAVYSIAFSPDGEILASCAHWPDQAVRLWDVQKQQQIGLLLGHTLVDAVTFSPDGKTLASGGADETVRLWDVQKQRQVGLLLGHTSSVRCVAFSPDGKWLASGGSWDVDLGFGGATDKTIRLWDVDAQKQVGLLDGHVSDVHSVAFSPGGKWLASGSYDGTVLLWELDLSSNPRPVGPEKKLPGSWGEIKETKLLQNFPNPFNPETWIPFRLAEASDVTIRIYQQSGQSVRTLDLGSKEEGIYLEKSRAGYWDGRNDTGESVASGVYFYTLETGSFSQTRKMTVLR